MYLLDFLHIDVSILGEYLFCSQVFGLIYKFEIMIVILSMTHRYLRMVILKYFKDYLLSIGMLFFRNLIIIIIFSEAMFGHGP